MEQFNLEKWLKDKSRKVVTRDGRPVRIAYWDLPGEYKIIGVTDESDDGYTVINKKTDGTGGVSTNDLFFANEEEFTEFKEVMISFAYAMFDHLLDVSKEVSVEEWKDRFFDLARKKILKDLPKLEKTEGVTDPTIPVMYTNAASMKSYVEYNGYKVCINELFESLPKEE